MPYKALDFLVQRALWRPSSDVIPPQYAVFEFVPAPATFFNFNLDGLARLYCSHRHTVLEPHGRIDVPWFEHKDYRKLLEGTLVYEARIPHLTPKLLPGPEPEEITVGRSYAEAQKLIFHARAMIILGYSFGERGATFDDKQSFEFVVALLKDHSRPVVVISPTPVELTERLRDRLSTYNVHSFPLRWELFSGLLLASINPIEGINPYWCSRRLRSFTRMSVGWMQYRLTEAQRRATRAKGLSERKGLETTLIVPRSGLAAADLTVRDYALVHRPERDGRGYCLG